MTLQAPIETIPSAAYAEIPRQPNNGRRFFQCRTCGGWVDTADARQMADHDADPTPAWQFPKAS